MILVPALALAMAALTWLLGWWGVLLAATIIGVALAERDGIGWRTALAAALAWGALLVVDALAGPLGVVSATLGGVMRMPGVVLVLLTLVFPALLAWSGATAAAASRRLVNRRR